jgi:hypothetical protein
MLSSADQSQDERQQPTLFAATKSNTSRSVVRLGWYLVDPRRYMDLLAIACSTSVSIETPGARHDEFHSSSAKASL